MEKPEEPKEIRTDGSLERRGTLFSQPGPVRLSDISGAANRYETSIPQPEHRSPPPPPPPTYPESYTTKPAEAPYAPAEYERPATQPVSHYPVDSVLTPGFQKQVEKPTSNASVSWSPSPWKPRLDPSCFIHPDANIIGNVKVGVRVFVASGVNIRGENDEAIFIGGESNIQEGVVIKDLPSKSGGVVVSQRIVDVDKEKYSLYIGERVSITPQALIQGPAFIGDNVYIGMQSLVFWARIEKGVILEPGCLVMNVTIPSGKFVPAGLKVTTQKIVDDLPPLTDKYRFSGIGEETVAAHLEMVRGYRNLFRM